MRFVDDRKCFACGPDNPIGLGLEFCLDERGKAIADFTPPEHFQGYSNVLHGGVICTLLDEAMAWAMILHGYLGATITLRAKFRRPVHIGKTVTIAGEVVRRGPKTWALRSEIADELGRVAADAEGTFLVVSEIPARNQLTGQAPPSSKDCS